jgi:hypothetical protein
MTPKAIIFIIISSEKITVRILSIMASVIKNAESGSLRGLSAASCTVLIRIIRTIEYSKYLCLTKFITNCLKKPPCEKRFRELNLYLP